MITVLAAGPPAVRLAVALPDGSRVIGTPAIDSLKVTTDYASLQIPLLLLSSIDLSGTSNLVHVTFQNGDLVTGKLVAREIGLKTLFGQVSIPVSQIRAISAMRVGGVSSALPDGCVLHYSFDSDEGGHVTDLSGGGNDGEVRGATYTPNGKTGGAMSFNGDRVAVVIGNPASIQLQDFTIIAWVKRGDVNKPSARDGEDAELCGYGHGGYMLGMGTDGRLFLSKIDFSNVTSSFQITDDSFHHIAVTKHGSQVVFYLDGVGYRGPDYNPGFEFTTDAAVGSRADMMVHSFLGAMDEVAVFNRALSADEIKGIHDTQK